MNKKDLWNRLRGYHFDDLVPTHLTDQILELFGGTDASTKAFADKIARKENWKTSFALKAVTEYKKFVYLAMISDTPVTPSKVIDKVWHAHQLFNRGYRTFCQTVLERNFDHEPELVPFKEETTVFGAQYMATLELYKTEFGIDPPDDVWDRAKFNKEIVLAKSNDSASRKRSKSTNTSSDNPYSNDVPLHMMFIDGSSPETSHGTHDFPEFSGFGGGSTGGGGAGGSWEQPEVTTPTYTHTHTDTVTDTVANHGYDGPVSVDTGSSNCSSSCSSSCGGGD